MRHFKLVMTLLFFTICTTSAFCKVKKDTLPNRKNLQEKSFQYPFAGSDNLDRTLPSHQEVGNPKMNKQVGIFYFLWQGDQASKTSENFWDLSEIIPQHPEVLEDGDNQFWGSTNRGFYYFWGKPIYGYYRGDDYWVHLRNIQLLTDAAVDFLVIDATNTLIYPEQSDALMRAIKAVQDQGKNPPKMVYYTNTESGKTMQNIYNTYYKDNAPYYNPSTWYYLDGKPLIIGISKEAADKDYESFFAFRESQWPNEPIKENGWPWIDFNRPQNIHYNQQGEKEIINVSVAQHPNAAAGMGGSAFYGNKDNWGRSYRNGSNGNPDKDIFYGYNAQEQWDYAIKQDVPFIFITGWNEWIAGRWESTDNNPKHSYFCDQANPEYSRDIEPTYSSGLKDNYYMQMVANIRKYKGVNVVPTADKSKTIKEFKDWNSVSSIYFDYTGETVNRNHPGAELNPQKIYTNNTGRNDFYLLKVSRDVKNLYFYAETIDDITPQTDNNWMNLYINADRKAESGWEGYDFRTVKGTILQKYSNGRWIDVGPIVLKKEGRKMFYSIPISYLSLNNQNLDFEFKWSDNMQDENNPLDWYVNGDAAPGGRFNFVYRTM